MSMKLQQCCAPAAVMQPQKWVAALHPAGAGPVRLLLLAEMLSMLSPAALSCSSMVALRLVLRVLCVYGAFLAMVVGKGRFVQYIVVVVGQQAALPRIYRVCDQCAYGLHTRTGVC
jgi:hypothetical protein